MTEHTLMCVRVYRRLVEERVFLCWCVRVLQGNRHMHETKSASDKNQTRLRARDVVPLLTKPRNNYSSAAQS